MDHGSPRNGLDLFILVTIGFVAGFPRVEVRTIFKNLLPTDDPFVQVYYDHPNFGNPLTMYIMVKRVGGDIYHQDTLQKVWDLTRSVDLTPAIDHDQLISISTEKLRYVEATPEGVDVPRLAVGVYATSASTPLFFAQAIGRFVRARRRGSRAPRRCTATASRAGVPGIGRWRGRCRRRRRRLRRHAPALR